MHDAEEVKLQFRVVGHGVVGGGEGEDGGGVHGGVDGDFVPADHLEFGVGICRGVFDAAFFEECDEGIVALGVVRVGGLWAAGVEVWEVGPAVDARPAVVLYDAVGGLGAGGDCDGGADWRVGEARGIGCFNAQAVLDEDYGGLV